MPLRVERRDVVLHDGLAAAAALGREHVEVVGAAVGLALALVEPVLPELLAALRAEEVLRVPRLLQRRHAFLEPEIDIITIEEKSFKPLGDSLDIVFGVLTSRMGPLQYAHRGENRLW